MMNFLYFFPTVFSIYHLLFHPHTHIHCTMSDLFGAAYRGDPSIPHVSENFYKLVIVSANV